MNDAATWMALAAFVTAVGGTWLQWRKQPAEVRQAKVETSNIEVDGLRKIIEEYRLELDRSMEARNRMEEQLKRMQTRVESTRRELTTAEHRIFKLEEWVRSQGTDPASLYH